MQISDAGTHVINQAYEHGCGGLSFVMHLQGALIFKRGNVESVAIADALYSSSLFLALLESPLFGEDKHSINLC